MVQVKLIFSGWKLVNKETAKSLIEHWIKGITMMSGQKKIDYINQNCLKGITVEQLLEV